MIELTFLYVPETPNRQGLVTHSDLALKKKYQYRTKITVFNHLLESLIVHSRPAFPYGIPTTLKATVLNGGYLGQRLL